MKYILGIILSVGFLFLTPSFVYAADYYVSTTGSGTTCASSNPCSLNSGLGKTVPGDTLYLRGGSYNQTVRVTASGTSSAYITISGYPGESAVIDGLETLGSNDLVSLGGAYIELKDLKIQNSAGNNIVLWGDYDILNNVDVTRSYANGIRAVGNHQIVENCRVYYNSLISEFGKSSGYDGSIEGDGSTYLTIRNNRVWNNWGEGINPYNSSYAIVEDNISYDNLRMNYLLDSCDHALFQRNLAYVTPGNALAGYPYDRQGGFTYEEEPDEPNIAQYNTVINNVSVGGKYGFSYYYYKPGSGILNTVIANNTFITNISSGDGTIQFTSGGTHSNSYFMNNIIEQDGTDVVIEFPSSMTGVSFDYNLWSKTPNSLARGAHDLIGDPMISKIGSFTPGNLTADYFRLKTGSPAINKALVLSSVTEDYFRTPRGSLPDMGAIEYTSGSTPTNTPTSAPTPAPKPGDANGDGKVDETDYAIWLAHYTQHISGGASVGDFNGDGTIDGIDYTIWVNNFGK